MFQKFKLILPWIVLLFLVFLTVKPMFIKGYFPMHDDTQPARVFAMASELKKGVFPVRIVDYLGYGYGYPLFNFYAPLPYYFGALFYLAGFDLVSSTKLMFILGVFLSAVFMYLLGRSVAGRTFGLIASVFFLLAPYHAVNIYVRGAVGEYYAYAFLPLLALGIYGLLKSDNTKSIFLGALGLAGILLSHNILGFITLVYLLVFFFVLIILFVIKKLPAHKIQSIVILVLFGFGLSAFFTVPAFFEKSFTRVSSLTSGGSNYTDHFITLSQAWDSPWGFGGSTRGDLDGLSFKIGKFHLITALASFLYILTLSGFKKIKRRFLFAYLTILFLFLLSFFMMLSQSAFIYKALPLLAFVQYPWRFLNLSVFFVSLFPLAFSLVRNNYSKIIIALLLFLATVLINLKNFNPQFISGFEEKKYLSAENLRFTISKISDEYLPEALPLPQNFSDIYRPPPSTENYSFKILKESATGKTFQLEVYKPFDFNPGFAFFPGWRAHLDGQELSIRNQEGFISLNLPVGSHILELSFKNSRVRTVSNAISILSFILLVYVALMLHKSIWAKRNHLK